MNDWEAMVERIHSHLGIPKDYALKRKLEIFPEATHLVLVMIDSQGKPFRLEPQTASAWLKMEEAALKDSIKLIAFSGFRSYKYQLDLIRGQTENGKSIDEVLRKLAAPGFSEHHTGRAIDITAVDCPPATDEFEGTKEFVWLTKYAGDFQFVLSYPVDNIHGFIYEPWHWAYQG